MPSPTLTLTRGAHAGSRLSLLVATRRALGNRGRTCCHTKGGISERVWALACPNRTRRPSRRRGCPGVAGLCGRTTTRMSLHKNEQLNAAGRDLVFAPACPGSYRPCWTDDLAQKEERTRRHVADASLPPEPLAVRAGGTGVRTA